MATEAVTQVRQAKPRQAKKVKVVEQAPVVEAPVVEAPVEQEAETSTESEDQSLEEQLNTIRELVNQTCKDLAEKLKVFKGIDQDLKKFSVSYKKELKSKSKKPKKVKSDKPSNHGFNAEVAISDELASFLEMEKGSKIRRPAVAKMISDYAIKNNLKDNSDKTIYLPDAKLKKVFGPATLPIKKAKEGEKEYPKGYSIFNIQTYLKRHFIKASQ